VATASIGKRHSRGIHLPGWTHMGSRASFFCSLSCLYLPYTKSSLPSIQLVSHYVLSKFPSLYYLHYLVSRILPLYVWFSFFSFFPISPGVGKVRMSPYLSYLCNVVDPIISYHIISYHITTTTTTTTTTKNQSLQFSRLNLIIKPLSLVTIIYIYHFLWPA
jgi:hypothetical protein